MFRLASHAAVNRIVQRRANRLDQSDETVVVADCHDGYEETHEMVGHTRRAAADTDLLPPAVDRKGANGNLLSLAVMRDAILWLAGDCSNRHSGERYVARLSDGPDAARDASVPKPRIM